MTFVVKTLEGIRGIVYVYVMILVMFLWFIYLPGFECCEQIQSENFELRKVLGSARIFEHSFRRNTLECCITYKKAMAPS